MTRAGVEQLLKAAPQGPGDQRSADLEGKRLSHLDLSGLDFSGSNLRLARLNRTDLKGARFDRAILNQAWLIDEDLTGASLVKASLLSTQSTRQAWRGRVERRANNGDLSGASMVGAKLAGADLSADMHNQSMGLMRGVLKSADLRNADLSGANLSRANLEFAGLQKPIWRTATSITPILRELTYPTPISPRRFAETAHFDALAERSRARRGPQSGQGLEFELDAASTLTDLCGAVGGCPHRGRRVLVKKCLLLRQDETIGLRSSLRSLSIAGVCLSPRRRSVSALRVIIVAASWPSLISLVGLIGPSTRLAGGRGRIAAAILERCQAERPVTPSPRLASSLRYDASLRPSERASRLDPPHREGGRALID